MAEAYRMEPLDGRLDARPGLTLTPAPAAERLSIRAGGDAAEVLGSALGLALPDRPGSSAHGDGVSALWLGPDEWLVIADSGANLAARLPAEAEYSAVDISHRNTAMILEGPKAQAVLNSGCPRDLSLAAFPVGACARTILAKCEIVLLREDELRFRVECWRSFSDYVWKYCLDSAKSA